jgi:hypothetical protein
MINKPYVVAAGEFNAEESGRAISALAHALYLKQVGALARWVQKKGDTEKVGVLLPYLEDGVSLLHFIQVIMHVTLALL